MEIESFSTVLYVPTKSKEKLKKECDAVVAMLQYVAIIKTKILLKERIAKRLILKQVTLVTD